MTTPSLRDTADADLMHQVGHGDRSTRNAAFHELVERHRDRVHAICHRYFRDATDAEDATQETFLTVLRRAGTFRDEAQVSTWMYRVAVNTCHDMARHRARRPQTPVEDIGLVSDLQGETHSDEEQLAAMAMSDVLREALWISVVVSAPILTVALVSGLVIGLFQALTSIQEMTLTFVPKVLCISAVFWITMGFMTRTLLSFFETTIVPLVAGG